LDFVRKVIEDLTLMLKLVAGGLYGRQLRSQFALANVQA